MATTINLRLQQTQENGQHVMLQTGRSITTFTKLPWKASQLKQPLSCYRYSSRQTSNALISLAVSDSHQLTSTDITSNKISLISQPAQLQPRLPTRRYPMVSVPRHKCVSSRELYLYPDPLGDLRTDLCKFFHRISDISQLEEETIKREEQRQKMHCRVNSSSHSSRPSSEKTLTPRAPVKTNSTSYSTAVSKSPKYLHSHAHYFSTPNVRTEDCDVEPTIAAVSSPTHSENSSQPICAAPVILTNGKLSSYDCQQAQNHLRRSVSHDHVPPRNNTKPRRRLHQRSSSATTLTTSGSSTSISSTCSERYHGKYHRTKTKHKK